MLHQATVRRAAVAQVYAGAGDGTLVAVGSAPDAGARIRVLALYLKSTAAVTLRLESTAGGTALTGLMTPTVNGDISWPFNPEGWVETNRAELLNLEAGGAATVGGVIVYQYVP